MLKFPLIFIGLFVCFVVGFWGGAEQQQILFFTQFKECVCVVCTNRLTRQRECHFIFREHGFLHSFGVRIAISACSFDTGVYHQLAQRLLCASHWIMHTYIMLKISPQKSKTLRLHNLLSIYRLPRLFSLCIYQFQQICSVAVQHRPAVGIDRCQLAVNQYRYLMFLCKR